MAITRDLDTVIRNSRQGRATCTVRARRCVTGFLDQPVAGLFDMSRDQNRYFLEDFYHAMRVKTLSVSYGQALDERFEGSPGTDLLFYLSCLSLGDRQAVAQYDFRREHASVQDDAQNGQETEQARQIRKLYYGRTQSFLDLPVREFADYLAQVPDPLGLKWDTNASFRRWFEPDISLAEKEHKGIPVTIGQVLLACNEVLLTAPADLPNVRPFDSGIRFPAPDPDALERPFREKNETGRYWPPSVIEMMRAAARVRYLVYDGMMYVHYRNAA